jgi:hypothetical protein
VIETGKVVILLVEPRIPERQGNDDVSIRSRSFSVKEIEVLPHLARRRRVQVGIPSQAATEQRSRRDALNCSIRIRPRSSCPSN